MEEDNVFDQFDEPDQLPANAAPTAGEQNPFDQFDAPPARQTQAANPFDQFDGGPEAEGMLGTAGREAAHSVVPAATGVLAAGALGALGGSVAGPVGAFVGGVGGMIAGSMGGEYAQNKVLKAAGVDDDVQRAVNKEANPVSSFVGGVAPFIGSPIVGAEKTLAGQFTGNALKQRAAGGAMMGAFEGGKQLYEGEFHPGELAANVAFGVVMPSGNAATRAIHGAGEGAVKPYLPGRPDTQARPGAEEAKADAAVSESPDVAGNNANAQQPAPDPKAPNDPSQVAGSKVKADGAQDGSKKKFAVGDVFGESGKGFFEGEAHEEPTMVAGLKSSKPQATPAPVEAPTNSPGQVINAGFPERPAAPPAPDPLAARYNELKAQYDALNPRSPEARAIGVEINQIARAGRQRDATREQIPPPEAPKTDLVADSIYRDIEAGKVDPAVAHNDEAFQELYATRRDQPRDAGDIPDQKIKPASAEAQAIAKMPDDELKYNIAVEQQKLAGRTANENKKTRSRTAEIADQKMVADLRAKGMNERAAAFEATPIDQRRPLRDQIRKALDPRVVRNDRGKEVGSGRREDRDIQNSAIAAVAKAYEAHPPKENETAAELSQRQREIVQTAQEAHGGRDPFRKVTGYMPSNASMASPEFKDFAWYKHLRNATHPEHWTQAKVDAFRAEEDLIRAGGTKNPDALDNGIALAGKEGGGTAERLLEKAGGAENPESALLDKIEAQQTAKQVYENAVKAAKGETEPFQHETEEQETDVRPKKTPVASLADINAVEKRTNPLIEPVRTKEPPSKAKTVAKQIEERAKAAMEAKGTKRSGIELTPEEVEAQGAKLTPRSKIDPDTAAKYIKLDAENRKAQALAAATEPGAREAVTVAKYSPLNVGTRDMLGKLVSNEKGGLDLKKVGADFKALFDRFAKVDTSGWTIEVQPTYIGRKVKTEAEQAARNIGEVLNRASKIDNVVKIHALAGKEQAHILADTPEQQRAMYDAIAAKDPAGLDPHLKNVFEDTVLPVHIENHILYNTIAHDHPEVDIGRPTEDGLLRRALNGGDKESELESIGDNTDPTAGSSPISTNRGTPVMERQFVALEDADGNRHVIHLKVNEFGKPTGEFSVWKNYKNNEVPKDAAKVDPKFQVNDILEIGDRRFKMKDATLDEIEANALGNDGKPMKYQRDAAASVFTQNAYLRQLQNHLNALDEIKNSPEFHKYATKSNNEIANNPDTKGWQKSDTPGFDDYWMDPHMRETLEDAYQQGFNDSALNKVRNFSRAMTQSIFWIPTAHALNVEVHWAVGRGWKWLPTTNNYRGLAETGSQAIKSVITHDKIQDILHENGAGLIYGGTRAENANAKLALGIGEAIKRDPTGWGPIADKLNMTVGELVRGVYKASRHGMWSVNDMFLTQAILENLRDKGLTVDKASPAQIRESIAHIERHIPNYRTPSRIMSADEGGRTIAKAMRDPLFFGFGRYRYAVFNSFANMTNSVLHGSKAERIETAGQMVVMAAVAFGVYPLIYKPIAQLLTGNKEAEVRGRGPAGPIMHTKNDVFGRGDFAGLVKETISLSPLASSAIEFWQGKNFAGKDIMNKKDVHDALRGDPKAAYNAAKQGAGWALGQRYSPVSTLNSALNNPNQGVAGGLRDQFLDYKNPSPKSQKYEAQTPRRLQKDTVQRNKAPPSILEKLLP